MQIGTEQILQLGHPDLRKVSADVADVHTPEFRAQLARLQATLAAFRQHYGFGRAIAAPQIGVARRCIAVDLGHGPFAVINPAITWHSKETFSMWDDCMSFPALLVKVRRHRSISLRYVDADGQPQSWDHLAPADAELLQHEIDHLDGILAVDRALDPHAIISRDAYQQMPGFFDVQVDGVPQTPDETASP